MNGFTPSLAIITPFAESDRDTGRDAGNDTRDQTELHNHYSRNAACERNGRTDREIKPPTDDHKCHADRDHGHDRGLHEYIGQVKR